MNKFGFDKVADEFDEHINLSIRGYDNLYKDVVDVIDFFVVDDTNFVDIGSSTGKLISDVKKKHNRVNYIGIESESGFEKYPVYENITLIKDVIDYKFTNCSVVTSIFTMQFVPINKRLDILKSVYEGLLPGGVFIISEKVEMKSPFTGIFQDILINNKRPHFKDSDILDKNYSLRKIMRCLSIEENLSLLNLAGFSNIQQFWQNNRFVGFVCRKDIL